MALYASTPEYEKILKMHGWNVDLSQFIELSRQGRWKDMGKLVTDNMLESYAVVALPADLPGALHKRFGGLVNRMQIDETWFDGLTDDDVQQLVTAIKEFDQKCP